MIQLLRLGDLAKMLRTRRRHQSRNQYAYIGRLLRPGVPKTSTPFTTKRVFHKEV